MKKRIKIKQRDITDCGAACIASVAAYYRLQLPVSRVRQYAGTDRYGTNVLGLITAAERLGFQAKGAKGTIDSLPKIPLPAIAHVTLKNGLQHYVVIYQVKKGRIIWMDPADGELHTGTIATFKEAWSGFIVLLMPGDNFVKKSQKQSNVLRFWHLISPQRGMMMQALVGALVYTMLGVSTSIYMQKIVDFVLVEGNTRLLNLMSIAMILILLFQVIIGYLKSMIGLRTGQVIDARLILGYYKHLMQLPQRFFDTMRVGEIVSRINDAVKIRTFINDTALSMIVNILIVGFSLTIMFFYYWKLALIMLTIIPSYLILYWISNRINRKWQRRLMEESAELETQLVESINAAGTVKRFGLEAYVGFKTETRFIELLRSIYKSGINGFYLSNASEFVTRLLTIVILWLGGYYVVQRSLTPGELLSFFALIGYFTGPAASLISANKNIQDSIIAADRLFEIIDLEVEASDDNKAELTPKLIGDIHFQDVHFRYGTRNNVFQGLDLTLSKGRCTAVVGESGSGKSTLLSLLQNLYSLQQGSITIGGLDIRYLTNHSLRRMIAVVPQQIDLFAGTVIENIALGDYEPDIQRVIALSMLLGINEFIEELPNSYYAIINEQGTNLSGGQKQRLAIARALYRNPEVLILDEATSSLDPVSEQKVQDALKWFLRHGKTAIIIAHRLSTIRDCDQILVLKNGKLIEQGAHKELLLAKGIYAELWAYQVGTLDNN
ncbi:MAG: peptidase domain-containing ABC transporter [Sediminibacterium magnilacihabitans]|jgi:ABC-type bacteriocin transporter|nr:peptidase domain-containing ABC transporter [Sediminibacterium magnilacihabitans]PQV59336.1 ATP-binding cassette subfamily B protein [Sediminibacterium magnilacihabitans]